MTRAAPKLDWGPGGQDSGGSGRSSPFSGRGGGLSAQKLHARASSQAAGPSAHYKELRRRESDANARPGLLKQTSFSSEKAARRIYDAPGRGFLQTVAQERVQKSLRESAAAWRQRQMEQISAIQEKRAQQADAEPDACMLKGKHEYESIAPRYLDPPAPRESGQQQTAAGTHKAQKQEIPHLGGDVGDDDEAGAKRPPTEAERTANRAIRLRQEQLLQQKALQRNQEAEARRAKAAREAAMRRAAQQTVMKQICQFRESGGITRLEQRKMQRSRFLVRPGEETAALDFRLAQAAPDVAEQSSRALLDGVQRWCRRFGVRDGTLVFVADSYGEPLAKKLISRGWARNLSPTGADFNLLFTRRGNDIPHSRMHPCQIVNHFPGGDALTTKSGLHDCIRSIQASQPGSTDDFYPRSYFFGKGGAGGSQLDAFVRDFRHCSAVALLWLTAASSSDGVLPTSAADGGMEEGTRIDAQIVELCLLHVRARLRCMGARDAAESLKTGARSAHAGSPPQDESGARPPGTPLVSGHGSILSEGQWATVCGHFDSLSKAARLADPLSLDRLSEDHAGSVGAWAELRGRALRALSLLRELQPQESINGRANAWVIKPCGAARGEGVKVMAEMGRIIAELQAGMPRVVQKYVERPLLLDRRKADLRVWVAVLRFEPLVAYMYEQVMVRPASQGFTLSRELLPNPAVHLCNHAVQCGLLAARRRRQRLSPGARSTSSPRPRPRARSPAPRARSAATSYRPGAPLDGSAGAGRPVTVAAPDTETGSRLSAGATRDTPDSSRREPEPLPPLEATPEEEAEEEPPLLVARVVDGVVEYFAMPLSEEAAPAAEGRPPSGTWPLATPLERQPPEETDGKEESSAPQELTPPVAGSEMVTLRELLPWIGAAAERARAGTQLDGETASVGGAAEPSAAVDTPTRGPGIPGLSVTAVNTGPATSRAVAAGCSSGSRVAIGRGDSPTEKSDGEGIQAPRPEELVAPTSVSKVWLGGLGPAPPSVSTGSGDSVQGNQVSQVVDKSPVSSSSQNSDIVEQRPQNTTFTSDKSEDSYSHSVLNKASIHNDDSRIATPNSGFIATLSGSNREEAFGLHVWCNSIVPAMERAASSVLSASARHAKPEDAKGQAFELYGFDFLIEEDGKRVWLLEVNESPDLRPHCQAKAEAGGAMLDDLLDLTTTHLVKAMEVQQTFDASKSSWEQPPVRLGGWRRIS